MQECRVVPPIARFVKASAGDAALSLLSVGNLPHILQTPSGELQGGQARQPAPRETASAGILQTVSAESAPAYIASRIPLP